MSDKRLMIVDDDAAMVRVFRRVAEELGFEVEAAHSGTEFYETYAAAKPNAVLLDITMPDTDGIELLGFLAQDKSTARIVIISGADNSLIRSAGGLGSAYGLDIVATLTKPVRAAELRAVLADL
jgi:CheY-like chemotaxis protein